MTRCREGMQSPQPEDHHPPCRPLVVEPVEIGSSVVAVLPAVALFMAIYAEFVVRPWGSVWANSPWAVAAASTALALVAVARKKYDGWELEGGALRVERGRVVRRYPLSSVESVKTRKFCTGLASVRKSSTGDRSRPWLHCEIRARMDNGDTTVAVLPVGDFRVAEIERLMSPSPAPID